MTGRAIQVWCPVTAVDTKPDTREIGMRRHQPGATSRGKRETQRNRYSLGHTGTYRDDRHTDS